MSGRFNIQKFLMLPTRTFDLGIYNLKPCEVFIINQLLPFGTKLELEERYLKNTNRYKMERSERNLERILRRRRNKRKGIKKRFRRLIYNGKQNINPYSLMLMKCNLIMKKISENPNAFRFVDNVNIPTAPSLSAIQQKLRGKGFTSYFDFKKALRWLWLYYFLNFEGNKEIIQNTGIMCKYTEESFKEIESLTEEEIQKRSKYKNINSQEANDYPNKQINQIANSQQSLFNQGRQLIYNNISGIQNNNNNNNNHCIPKQQSSTLNVKSNNKSPIKQEHQEIQGDSTQNNNNSPFPLRNNNLGLSNSFSLNNFNNSFSINPIIQQNSLLNVSFTNKNHNIPQSINSQKNNESNYFNPPLKQYISENLHDYSIEQLSSFEPPNTSLNENTLSLEEKNLMRNLIQTLTQRQLKGIVSVLQDYFDQNTNANQKYFEFDISKLNVEQLTKLKNYLNECVIENEKKQEQGLTNKKACYSINKFNENSNIKEFNSAKVSPGKYNHLSNPQGNNNDEFDYIKFNKGKKESNSTSRGVNKFLSNDNQMIFDKGNNTFRTDYEYNNINLGNSNTLGPSVNRNIKNDYLTSVNQINKAVNGVNPHNSNWNMNYLTTKSRNNYLNVQSINNPHKNNGNNQNNEIMSDSGSFDFH